MGKAVSTGVGGVEVVDREVLLQSVGTEISRRHPHKGVHLLLLAHPDKYCLAPPLGLVLNRFCALHPQDKALPLILFITRL